MLVSITDACETRRTPKPRTNAAGSATTGRGTRILAAVPATTPRDLPLSLLPTEKPSVNLAGDAHAQALNPRVACGRDPGRP